MLIGAAAELDIRAQVHDPIAVHEQVGLSKFAKAVVHRDDRRRFDQGAGMTLSRRQRRGDGRITCPCARNQIADRVALKRTRIPVGIGHGEIRRLVDAVLGHTDVAQRQLRIQPPGEIVEPCAASEAPKARAIFAIASGTAGAL